METMTQESSVDSGGDTSLRRLTTTAEEQSEARDTTSHDAVCLPMLFGAESADEYEFLAGSRCGADIDGAEIAA